MRDGTHDNKGANGASKPAETFKVVDRRHHAQAADAAKDAQASEGEPSRHKNPDAERSAGTASAPTPDARDEEIQRLGARADELARAYAAALEDQKEFRGRMTRENERVLANERFEIARLLIESIDDVDRCLSAAGDGSPLTAGVRLIRDGMVRRLATLGVERLALVGTPFDPNMSEAVAVVEVDDPKQQDSVIDELVPGYKIGDRVVRPAKVRVGRVV